MEPKGLKKTKGEAEIYEGYFVMSGVLAEAQSGAGSKIGPDTANNFGRLCRARCLSTISRAGFLDAVNSAGKTDRDQGGE